jgi:hypothetical protein
VARGAKKKCGDSPQALADECARAWHARWTLPALRGSLTYARFFVEGPLATTSANGS